MLSIELNNPVGVEIPILITRAVEGSLAPVECMNNSDVCFKVEAYASHEVWARLKELIVRELSINVYGQAG